MSPDLIPPILIDVAMSALSGALFCLKIAAVLLPALVLYEVLAPLPVFARIGRAIGPKLSRIGMSPASTVPLAAGTFLGIGYGAGIIIPIAKKRRIDAEELQSLGLFLATCHAIVEDTLLFALIGARGPWEVAGRMAVLVSVRVLLAVGVTAGRTRIRRGRARG